VFAFECIWRERRDKLDESFPMTWEQAVQWLRDQPDHKDLVEACYFDDPLPDAALRYHAGDEWKNVVALLPSSPGLALDVGAGRGIASYALARGGWKVVALEPDPSDLVGAGAIRSLAEETGTDIEVVGEWGECLPFADRTFDCVHARQVLHHAKDLENFCREIARVLKPGGTFVATREHVVNNQEELSEFLASHPLHRLYGGEYAFGLENYLDAILGAGLLLTRVLSPLESPVNYFPAGKKDIDELVSSFWPWKARPGVAMALREAVRKFSFPGRLHTFVAMAPQTGKSDEFALIAAQSSRLTALEARLDAREIQLAGRLNPVPALQSGRRQRRSLLRRLFSW
jgi:SAM-dependent methyltransferase